VNPKDVAKSYDQLAQFWGSAQFPRDNGTEQHKRAIAFSRERGLALDVGCGSSGRLIDLLLDERFTPEGLDVSQEMIELARRRHPHLTFYHEDVCEWVVPHAYDFITAWDSIWHVPLDAQESVLLKLVKSLNPGGVIIFSMGGTDVAAETVNSFMGPKMYHSTIGIPRALEIIASAGVICRHLEYDQYPELHVYVIGQRT